MLTPSHGRVLKVIVIDDRDQNVFTSGFDRHFHITHVKTWSQAQQLLAGEDDFDGADLLLVDICVKQDDEIKKAARMIGGEVLLPAGPLLALPFIGRRGVMACVIYSAHNDNVDLHADPNFLLAMGLIAARMDGMNGSPTIGSQHLDIEAKEPGELDRRIVDMSLNGAGNPGTAVKKALRLYLARLEKKISSQQVIVANATELIKRVDQLAARTKQEGRVKLEDDLSVLLLSRNWSEAICLRSLFADKLKFTAEFATDEWLVAVKTWLKEQPVNNVTRAVEIFRKQEDARTIEFPDAVKLAEMAYAKKLAKQELTDLTRLLVLFANAYVNVIEGSQNKEAIYARLGGKFDINRYETLFGLRNPGAKRRGPIDHLKLLAVEGTTASRCFLGQNSTISAEDYEAIQQFLSLFDEYAGVLPYKVAESTT